ncbi:MAG: 16S rRNA (uracil(1498)-N(3))-methyltransferase [Deltaproteobacteria bacterium]|nr:16S rRNA (uracil(1498)-N(3))-methyltransferase [Deltaproteobacteria bacterium]
MTTPRIFSPEILNEGRLLELERENSQYIQNVLRLRKGDLISLFDGRGSEYAAAITELSEGNITVEIGAKKNARLPALKITLAQSLPKGSKMDFIIQKSTELGVDRIIPFISSRSIPRLSENKALERRKRWERIAVEASRQCGRAKIPEVTTIATFEEMLNLREEESLGILLWEDESERGIKEILRDERCGDSENFFVIVGPEGGFLKEEAEKAVARDFISATLGTLILRAETAPLAILSILQYEKGTFGRAKNGAL